MKKDYLFYGAFIVGVLALVTVIAVYRNKSHNPDMAKEQSIDLNASNVTEDAEATESIDVINDDDVTALDKQKAQKEQPLLGAKKPETEETKQEEPETEETEGTKDDAASDAETETDTENSQASAGDYQGNQTLTWPVSGEVVLPYSMDTTIYFHTLKQYKCNPGMLIAAKEGEEVVSVYAGTVKEIGQNKEFGTYIVMDLGNGYEAFYGQLEDVQCTEGEAVSASDVIASVAAPTAFYVEEGSHLYFRITKDGEPVNPVALMMD